LAFFIFRQAGHVSHPFHHLLHVGELLIEALTSPGITPLPAAMRPGEIRRSPTDWPALRGHQRISPRSVDLLSSISCS